MATQDDLPTLVIPPDALPLEQNPAAVYLASLGSGSRRTMHRALDSIAAMLTAGNADALTCNWAALRFQHTAAIRAQLIARYAPANTRKHLSALRGTVDGPLFVPVHQSGRMRIARMTTQAAYNILDKRAREAGIENVTPQRRASQEGGSGAAEGAIPETGVAHARGIEYDQRRPATFVASKATTRPGRRPGVFSVAH
jgi:hypothetical protein